MDNLKEFTFEDKKVLFLEKKDSDSLIIIANTHNQKDRYLGMKLFSKNSLYNLLFITDPNNSYYLENDYGQSYKRLLHHFSKNFNPQNITFFGSSMSGYAALYHGVSMDFNVITVNPQLNFEVTYKNAFPDLKKSIENLQSSIALNEWLPDHIKNSVIYYIYGQHRLDVANTKLLNLQKSKQHTIFMQAVDCDKHEYFFGQNADYIFRLHEMLKSYRKFAKKLYHDVNIMNQSTS